MQPDATPLDVLLIAMRRELADGNIDKAVQIAKAAAPYVHPKALIGTTGGNLSTMRDKQLDAMRLVSQSRAGIAPEHKT